MRVARSVQPWVGLALCLFTLVMWSSSAFAQKAKTREVTGVVADVDAKPIANATVSIANGPTATTGADGAFKLAAPVTDAIIEISADGFTAKQVPILAATTALQLQLTLVKPAPPPTTTRLAPSPRPE